MKTDKGLHRRLSLRVLLLLIIAVALSPVLVIGAIRWSGDIEREAQYRRETMTLVAQVAAGRAEHILASAQPLLDLIGAAGAGAPCQLPFKAIVNAMPDFANFGFVDAQGKVACSSQDEAIGFDVTGREWFAEVRDGAHYVQSAAIIGGVSRQWTIAAARRRENPDGSFGGVFVLGTPVIGLVAQLEHSNLPRGYEVALLDGSGRVFSSRNWQMLDNKLFASVAPGKPGFFQANSDTGESRQAAIVPLAGSDFYAMVSIPTPPPIALENISAFGSFALPLLAWLLALVTAWLAMDRLVLRWLDYLGRIAGLYASGKLSVQPLRARAQAPGEINSLADTLEEMAVRIRDRTSNVETALSARDAAIKEIHHRVKNNLQIINSLLSMQGRKLKDRAAALVLDDARVRINALSLVHSSLYQHDNINTVRAQSFFADLAVNLGQAFGADDRHISIKADVDEDTVDADTAVPLALFTTEAVTNSLKHAFPDGRSVKGGHIRVCYKLEGQEAVLTIEDDGVGVDETQGGPPTGMGSTLMTAFTKQLRGALEQGRPPGGGRFVRIRMPRKTVAARFEGQPATEPAK